MGSDSGSTDQGGSGPASLRLIRGGAGGADGPMRPGAGDRPGADRARTPGRLVREYKGPVVDELIGEEEMLAMSERLASEMDSVLAAIERGDLERADRILEEGAPDGRRDTERNRRSRPRGSGTVVRARRRSVARQVVAALITCLGVAVAAALASALLRPSSPWPWLD